MSNNYLHWWKERCKKESSSHHNWNHTYNNDERFQQYAASTSYATLPQEQNHLATRLNPVEMEERERAIAYRESEIARKEATLRQTEQQLQQQRANYKYMGSRWGLPDFMSQRAPSRSMGHSSSRANLPPPAKMFNMTTPSVRGSADKKKLRTRPSKTRGQSRGPSRMSRSRSVASINHRNPETPKPRALDRNAGPGYNEFAPGQSTLTRPPRIKDINPFQRKANGPLQTNSLTANLPSYFNAVHAKGKKAIVL